ncbi:MAG: hypothetical protein CM1200mP30_03700 [Pseudomonadota bacterium]|nr:MAG: hypothetical protein CM1200mP30_03700 [Pseudomonadota bacterium]
MTPALQTDGYQLTYTSGYIQKKNNFTKAITTRMTPDSDAKLTQETAFHPRTSALTRNFTEYRGYWLPPLFPGNNGAVEEYYACRERAIVTDLSPLKKI